MKTKAAFPKTKQAAVKAMTSYIRKLANKIPAGQKIAQVQANMAAERRLTNLANELAHSGSIFAAVRVVYPEKSAAYHHKVISGLVSDHPTAIQSGAVG